MFSMALHGECVWSLKSPKKNLFRWKVGVQKETKFKKPIMCQSIARMYRSKMPLTWLPPPTCRGHVTLKSDLHPTPKQSLNHFRSDTSPCMQGHFRGVHQIPAGHIIDTVVCFCKLKGCSVQVHPGCGPMHKVHEGTAALCERANVHPG